MTTLRAEPGDAASQPTALTENRPGSTGSTSARCRLPPSKPSPTAAAEDRSSTALATRMAQLVIEVLNGRRSPTSLRENLAGPAYTWLMTRHHAAERRSYRLHSVHACLTTCRTVETCWIIRSSQRMRALVGRIERRQNTWLCTWLRPV